MSRAPTEGSGQRHELPLARRVLVVVAHPDDESFGLGAIVSTFVDAGAEIEVLCFTRGEASSLGGGAQSLAEVRAAELAAAAAELGVSNVHLLEHPDGHLADVPLSKTVPVVEEMIERMSPDLLLVFDEGGVTGHSDHGAATRAAVAAARPLPLLAWSVTEEIACQLNAEFFTSFLGRRVAELDFAITVDRTRQLRAISQHASQASDNPVLERRLALQGEREVLRWLRPPPPDR